MPDFSRDRLALMVCSPPSQMGNPGHGKWSSPSIYLDILSFAGINTIRSTKITSHCRFTANTMWFYTVRTQIYNSNNVYNSNNAR